MVNTKANNSKVSKSANPQKRIPSSELVGTLQGPCPLLPCINLWSSRQRRKTGCDMLFQPGEEKDYQDMEVESGWPTIPALQQLQQLITFFVMKQPLHTPGERRGPEMPGIQSCASPLQNYSSPIPKPLFSSQHQKDCIIRVWCKPHLQCLAFHWRVYYCQFTDTRHSGSSYQEAGTVGKLPFSLEFNTKKDFLLSPLAFLLFCASLHIHMKARRSNSSLSSTCLSNFSCLFFHLH